MLMPRYAMGALTMALGTLAGGMAVSQDYPNKPVRVIAGVAGSGSDFTSRLVVPGLAAGLGQPVIVDNRTVLLAAEAVSKAPPDGYSLTINGASLWILSIFQKAPYDVADFSPVSLLVREINVLAVHPSVPVKSVKELIALAKARPGELNHGTGATGAPSQLGGALLKSMAGVDIVDVFYKGTAARLGALIGGEMQLGIFDASMVMPHVKSGRLRALAVTSAQSSALAPGLPTVAASGLPGFEATGMTGIWAPAKTPRPIINRLNQEIVRVLNLPDVKEKFFNAGVEVVGNSPEQFAATIKSDTARWVKLIKEVGIKAD
jgi:tripartite-type tricarboxylate transporter receptor subunit TctC